MSLLARIVTAVRAEVNYRRVRSPKARGWPPATDVDADRIHALLDAAGIAVTSSTIDRRAYADYVARAEYARYPEYYAVGSPAFAEKSLEHFLAAYFLDLRPGQVYVDVASDRSPAPEIYARLFGVTAYRQDLRFAPGVNGDRIGGDAARMPVPDGFAHAMALHCSFEHFEGDADTGFVAECARVLAPGGAACVVPLYVSANHTMLTDPLAPDWNARIPFDRGAIVRATRGYGARHGRLYDAEQLASRVLAPAPPLEATIHHVTNAHDIDPSCYANFVLMLRKPVAPSVR